MAMRRPFIYFTGVLGIGAMSFAMILALRPVWLESWLDELDKTYRLHKWLGITALVMAVGHWLAVNAPKWATSLGLMERPQRGARPEITDLPAIRQWLNTQHDAAEMLGEWAFYAIALLIINFSDRPKWVVFPRSKEATATGSSCHIAACHVIYLLSRRMTAPRRF